MKREYNEKKQEYIEAINRLMQETNDINLLSIILKILAKSR